MEIKVLGSGCAKCKTLHKLVLRAIEELNLEANVEKVEDIQKIIEYGIMFTPALVINEEVMVKGTVPSYPKIKKLLTQIK